MHTCSADYFSIVKAKFSGAFRFRAQNHKYITKDITLTFPCSLKSKHSTTKNLTISVIKTAAKKNETTAIIICPEQNESSFNSKKQKKMRRLLSSNALTRVKAALIQ